MTIEDFTTYTEVEPDDRIQKTANHIDFVSYRNEDAYLYKDKGANHFGDFDHKIDAKLVSGYWHAFIWGIANGIDDLWALSPSIGITMHGSDNKIRIIESGSIKATTTGTFTKGTMYYFRVKRAGSSLTWDTYASASDRDSEVDKIAALSISATVTTIQFQYMYACSTLHYDIHMDNSTLDIENLDLQEVVPPTETIVANSFPMLYITKPATAKILLSKVEDATITHVAKEFPETLLKKGKAKELRSKWE